MTFTRLREGYTVKKQATDAERLSQLNFKPCMILY